jgi:hypothetical protein
MAKRKSINDEIETISESEQEVIESAPIVEEVKPEPVKAETPNKRYHLKKNGVGIFRDEAEAKRLVNNEGWAYASN